MRWLLFSPLRLWRNTRGSLALLAAASALAVVIWFVITDSEDEDVEERLGFVLAIEALNLPPELATASRIPTASLTIAGRRADIESVTIDDFEASIDLRGLPAGTHEILVRVRSLDADVRVRSVSPETVEVTVEPRVQRVDVPVAVVLVNPPPLGFEAGELTVSPKTVTLSGIQQLVDLVDVVVAPVDVSTATVDLDLLISLQARTSTGAAVSDVQIQVEPPAVNVHVPIQQQLFRRAVTVAPDVVGQPASGFHVTAVTVQPLTVIVRGTLAELENVGNATTAAVAIANVDEDLERVVAVRPPPGVELESDLRATVRVEVEPLTAQAVFDVAVRVVNLGDGLEAGVTPRTVAITVVGPVSVISDLLNASFRVTADADGLGEGAHDVPVQVSFSGGVDLSGVQPEDVGLLIVPLEPPEEAEPSEGEAAPSEGDAAPSEGTSS